MAAKTTKKKTEAVAEEAQVKTEAKTEQKMFSQADVEAMIARAVAEATQKAAKEQTPVVVQQTEPPVTVAFVGNVMSGSEIPLGDIGRIYADSSRIISVSKRVFLANITGSVALMLKSKELLVLSGLTDEERELYGLVYREGELLDNKIMRSILDRGTDEMKSIYDALCPEHRRIFAKAIHTAVQGGDRRVTPDKLRALIRSDKEHGEATTFRDPLKWMLGESGDDEEI